MPPALTCSECGLALPEGTSEVLCPVCALRGVADGGADVEPEAHPAEPGGRMSEVSRQEPADRDQTAEAGGQKSEIEVSSPTGSSAASSAIQPPAAAPHQPLTISHQPFPREFGDYELREEIARGGMGVVYRAWQKSLNRIVALKMIVGGPLASTAAIQRFRAEAQTVASLQHPNIVAIHEIGEHEGQPFFSMDYVKGQNLAGLLRDGPLPARRAGGYVKVIAEAVDYAHQRGILHRDLKPSNVLIDPFDQPQITDFGLAKQFVGADVRRLTSKPATDRALADGDQSLLMSAPTDLTLTGQVLGSPNFMAPEQAQGRQREVGPASDVYSMGAMLYHLVTGRPPFQAATLTEVLQQVVTTEPAAPRLLNPSVPRDLETICLKCLEKEAQRRYPTAQELAEDLGRFLQDQPIQARPVSAAGKAWKWCRRQPVRAGLIGALALVFVLGLTGVLSQWRRAKAGELIARQNAYAADMKEVQRALEDSDLGRALELLNRHRPVGKSEIRSPKSEIDLRGWEWRYFWSRCQSDESFTLCRYSNYVAALAFSSDGHWLAVRRRGGDVAVWDAVAKRPCLEMPGTDWGQLKALAFSRRGNLLAVGRRDPNGAPVVSFLDVSVDKDIASLPLSADLSSVAFSPDAKLIAALSRDGSVSLFEVASQRLVTQFLTGSLDLRPSTFIGSSATRSSPGQVTVTRGGFGAHGGTRVGPASNLFVLHYGCVLFSPDGRWLAVGEATPRIRLLDRTAGGEKVIELPPPADGITTLAFSPDGRLLAAGCGVLDHDVHVWDLVAGTELRLAGHSGWVAALAFSPDGQTLASASADQTTRLWDVSRQVERRRFQGSADEIWALAWLPDGKSLVTGGRDGAVRYWNPAAKPTVAPYSVLTALIYPGGLAFLPDSKSFLTATRPAGDVLRWDTATLQVVERLAFLETNHSSLALSKDARWLALGDAAGHVQVWDLPARRLVTNLVFNGVIAVLVFSPRDHMLGCGGLSSRGGLAMKLWKVPGWEEMDLRGIDLRGLEHAAFSSDDRMIAVGYFGGKAAWWDLASGTKAGGFDCPSASGGGVDVAFSSDGKMFAAAGYYGGVTLWDVASRQPRSISRAFRNLLYRLAFSPDGRRVIASGSSPQEVLRLWDVETGRDVATLPGEPGSYTIGFSPDGNTLCATANEGMALFWRAPSLAEIEAKEKVQGSEVQRF